MSIYDKIKALTTKDEEQEQEELSKPEAPFYKRPSIWLAGIGTLFLMRTLFSGQKRYTIRGDMYLTNNFQVKEFLRSSSIPELKDYQLTKDELSNLKRLASVLQHIRDDIGAPVIITSGGRPPYMTAKEGKYKGKNFVEILKEKNYKPAEFSQHMDFSACDFTTQEKRWLIDIMRSMTNVYFQSSLGKTITQVILYIQDGKPDFIHLGVASDINNFMRITEGKRLLLTKVTTFTKGDGTLSKKTEFCQYSTQKLNELLKA